MGSFPDSSTGEFMKRTLFLVTNLAVVVLLGIVAHLLGLDRYLTDQGLNLGGLLVCRSVRFWRRADIAGHLEVVRQAADGRA
jgi:hypothetical protein